MNDSQNMNDSQRIYIVNRIIKYKSDASAIDGEINLDKAFLFGSICLLIFSQYSLFKYEPNGIPQLIMEIFKYGSIIFGVDRLQDMIEGISKKVGLLNMATSLDDQLKIDELANVEKDNNRVKK